MQRLQSRDIPQACQALGAETRSVVVRRLIVCPNAHRAEAIPLSPKNFHGDPQADLSTRR
jgi:hypothetical protein